MDEEPPRGNATVNSIIIIIIIIIVIIIIIIIIVIIIIIKCSLPRTLSKNTIKMIGHHSRLRDVMAQSCPFMPVLELIARVIHRSTLHFAVARNIIHKSTTREKT